MKKLVLYCKSFSTDLKRVVRLAESVHRFNTETLPFYVSVPQIEIDLFRQHLKGLAVEVLADETIIQACKKIDADQFRQLPGNVSQQIVKSEFWRLNLSSSYLCLDSDAFFIRPFGFSDFMTPDGVPYTVINEAHDLLFEAISIGKVGLSENFIKEAMQIQKLFNRAGKAYNFGPMPMAWHRSVWESLDQQYLSPRGLNLMSAIVEHPLESRWYGEALLKYKAIPLMPSEPFFKVYHYAWQLDHDLKKVGGTEKLAAIYSGVIYQSAWERELDWPREGGSLLSRTGRRIRRHLGRI
jgi:hypothetical protein